MMNAVIEEKSQKIAEVMLGSVRPLDFMIGKLIGGVGVAITGTGIYVILGLLIVSYLGSMGIVPVHVIPWLFIYMAFAITMFGAVNTALGALCNDPRDAQNVMIPAMLPIIIPMFLMFPLIEQPTTTFATVTSLIPIFTPMLMLVRMATPLDIPAWQPWVGLLGIMLVTAGSIWISARIFRVGLLMQGKPPRLFEVIRLTFRDR